MYRTRVRRRRATLAGAAICLFLLVAGPARAALGHDAARTQRYVVRAGDTVWGIAQRQNPSADPRPLVDAIERQNHLGGSVLVPGEVIRVPEIG